MTNNMDESFSLFSPEFLDNLRQKEYLSISPKNMSSKNLVPLDESHIVQAVSEFTNKPPQDGEFVIKNKDGQIVQKVPYKNALIHGMLEIFSPQTGTLTQQLSYLKGQLNGPSLSYDIFEHLAQNLNFEEGILEDTSIFYNKGSLLSYITYKAGKKEGLAVFYLPSGAINSCHVYHNDKLESEIIFTNNQQIHHHYDAGKLVNTKIFLSGILQLNPTA